MGNIQYFYATTRFVAFAPPEIPSDSRVRVSVGLLLLGATVTQAMAASSWNPTVLVNTESFLTIDDGDSTTDIELRFGETLGEKLYYNRSQSRFQLTRGLFIQGNLTATGSLSVTASPFSTGRRS